MQKLNGHMTMDGMPLTIAVPATARRRAFTDHTTGATHGTALELLPRRTQEMAALHPVLEPRRPLQGASFPAKSSRAWGPCSSARRCRLVICPLHRQLPLFIRTRRCLWHSMTKRFRLPAARCGGFWGTLPKPASASVLEWSSTAQCRYQRAANGELLPRCPMLHAPGDGAAGTCWADTVPTDHVMCVPSVLLLPFAGSGVFSLHLHRSPVPGSRADPFLV